MKKKNSKNIKLFKRNSDYIPTLGGLNIDQH